MNQWATFHNIGITIMKFILEFSAVVAVGVLLHGLGTLLYIKRPEFYNLFTTSEQLLRRWQGGMAGVIIVLLVALNQPDGLRSVGLQNTNNGIAIWIGFLATSALVIVVALVIKLIQRIRKVTVSPSVDTSQPHIIELISYRDRWERFAYLAVVALGVVSEDLIYRGYFVLLLGNKTGTFIPWAILSVGLSVIIHLYQGRDARTILFHVVAASFLVSLAIITQNILAPIVAHLYYNLVATTKTWKLAKEQGVSLPAVEQSGAKKVAYFLFIGANILFLGFFAILAFGWILL
jgi:membrane protease YdiL (CAAX protease family)